MVVNNLNVGVADNPTSDDSPIGWMLMATLSSDRMNKMIQD